MPTAKAVTCIAGYGMGRVLAWLACGRFDFRSFCRLSLLAELVLRACDRRQRVYRRTMTHRKVRRACEVFSSVWGGGGKNHARASSLGIKSD